MQHACSWAMFTETASHTDAQTNADEWNIILKICCKSIPSMNTKPKQSERITESQKTHNHNKKSSLATIAIGAAAAAPVCVIPAEQSMLVCVCRESWNSILKMRMRLHTSHASQKKNNIQIDTSSHRTGCKCELKLKCHLASQSHKLPCVGQQR